MLRAPLLIAVLLLGAPSAPASKESQRLAAGEVLVELRPTGHGPREGIARGVIDAPPERVYRAVTDYGHYEEFMPFVVSSSAELLPDGSTRSAQRLDLPAPIGDRFYTVRARQRAEPRARGTVWHVDWAYVPGSGNVRDHRGSWELTRFGDGRTLAVCHMLTDPGGTVPDWTMDRATAKSLPWIFKGLRLQVGRSRYGTP